MYLYLPVALTSINIIIPIGLGLVVGLLSGLFGVGGGFLMTPLLIMLGIPATVAAATDSNQIVAASTSGTYAHWKVGNVDFKMGFHYINKTDNYDKVLLTCGYTRKIGQEITGEIDISHIELIRNTDTCFDQIDIFTMLPSILGELVKYKKIIVIEEQSYPGSTASLIMENANLQEWNPKVWFFGAPNSYVFENGGRDHIHGLCGMDSEWIIDRIKTCP